MGCVQTVWNIPSAGIPGIPSRASYRLFMGTLGVRTLNNRTDCVPPRCNKSRKRKQRVYKTQNG